MGFAFRRLPPRKKCDVLQRRNSLSGSEDDDALVLKRKKVTSTSGKGPAKRRESVGNTPTTKTAVPPRHFGKENAEQNANDDLMKAVLETNNLVKGLVHRVDSCEKPMLSMEVKLDGCSSSSRCSSTPSRKKAVPDEVRREIRRVYHMLVKEDESFDGWHVTPE